MDFFRRNRKHVAIDYDRREIRLVMFEYARRIPTIRSLHTAAIKPDVDISDPSSLGRFLGSVVERLGLRGANALMCVGRAQAVLKSLTLPPTADANELASMVQFQVSKELPFSPDEAVVDYTHGPHWDTGQAAEAASEGTTVLAAAVRLPVIDAAQQTCTEAGLRLRRLGLRPYANLRAACRCVRTQPGERLLLVSVTADEAEIDVMRGETLEFSRAATVYAPAEQAEAQTAVGPAQEKAACVRRVVAEVTRSLQSFHAVERGAQINACLVAGSAGLEKEIAGALSEGLGVRCQLLDPARGFSIAPSEGLGGFGAALGLAAGEPAGALPFDFLNPKRPAQPRDTRKLRAAAIAGAAVVLMGAAALASSSYLAAQQAVVDKLDKEKRHLETEKSNLGKLQKCVRNADIWLKSESDWLDELRHLSEILPPAQEVYLTSLKCSPGKVTLVGRVKNRQDALDFAERLMAIPGYEVRNKGTNPLRQDKFGYGLEFNFELLISPRDRAKTAPSTTRAAAQTKPSSRR